MLVVTVVLACVVVLATVAHLVYGLLVLALGVGLSALGSTAIFRVFGPPEGIGPE